MKFNKILKTGIFILIIFVPVLLFLFGYFFGKNHYEIPTYYPQGVDEKGDTIYHVVPDFEFIDQDSSVITFKDFDNKIIVIDFFFTSCMGPCPKMSEKMAYMQDKIKKVDDVMLLSHTVDPEFDQPKKLKDYGDLYKADYNYWKFVTGDKKALYKQAREGYFLVTSEGDGGERDFIHSQKLVLLDKEHRIRGYYDGTSQKEINRLLQEIEVLKYGYKQDEE